MSEPVKVAPPAPSQDRFVSESGEKSEEKAHDIPLPPNLRLYDRDDSSGAASFRRRTSVEDEEGSRYYFISEPSLSEDPSDSFRGGVSPHSSHLHGYSSPGGNTSISSKEGMSHGSPSRGNRKRPVFWEENQSLLGPMKDEEGDDNLLDGGNEKKEHMVKGIHSQIRSDEQTLEKKLIVVSVEMTTEGKKKDYGSLDVPSRKVDSTQKAHRLTKDAASPDSAMYLSAQESFGAENDTDHSSNLSYESSSVEENANKWVSTDKLLSPKSPNVIALLKETNNTTERSHYESTEMNEDSYTHLNNITEAGLPSSELESNNNDEDQHVASPKDGSPNSRLSSSSVEKPNQISRRHTIPQSEEEEELDGHEGINSRPRRKRIHSNESSGKRSGHRRTRSGDDVAATLITGGNDWIGMSLDQLPMPDERENVEDDEEDTIEVLGESSNRPAQRRRGALSSSFNVNESTSETTPRRKTKKSPLQELKDEGGAAWDTIRGSSVGVDNVSQFDGEESSKIKLSSRFDPHTTPKIDDSAKTREPVRNSSILAGELSDESGSNSTFSWITNKQAASIKSISARENTESNLSDQSDELVISSLENEEERMKFSSKNVNHQEAKRSPMPNGRGKTSVGENLKFLEEQRKKSEAYEAHMRTLGRMPRFEKNYQPLFVDNTKKYPTYICPRCNTEQREFFTIASAPQYISSPAGYMVICFVIYVTASLFIFGLQEGWPPLDCIYFSVTTLTTCGLGDYVPTTDSAKLICSIFVYFGVACMGLLLGQLHVNTLDEASNRAAEENKVNNCPNCARQLQSLRAPFKHKRHVSDASRIRVSKLQTGEIVEETNEMYGQECNSTATENIHFEHTPRFALQTIDETNQGSSNGFWNDSRSPHSIFSVGSAAAEQVMDRQSHTRHISLLDSQMRNKASYEQMAASQAKTTLDISDGSNTYDPHLRIDQMDDISEVSSYWSNDSSNEDLFKPVSHIKAAKYVFLTLKQAVANSAVVIALGSIGFYYIENLSLVDSIYFTVVLLSTVGYGDITPVTNEGKLFATVYGLLAHTVLLHNMSMISMIPLELRKRRIERAVLMQFGTDIDDAALRELASGPIVKRLQISENHHHDGLSRCTREMFALAMLVRLGRITEQDVKSTYAAFRKLDKDGDGVLTSKEIILGAVERGRRKPKQGEMDELSCDDLEYHQSVEEIPLYQHSHAANAEQGENASLLMRTRGLSMESQMSAMTYDGEDVETGEYQTFSTYY